MDTSWTADLVGKRLGGYTLERLIGSGGMAAVFEATPKTGSRVAVKILSPSMTAIPQCLVRFNKEAQALSRLGGQGAPALLGCFTTEGLHCIVQSLVPGISLDAYHAQNGALRPDDARQLGLDLLETLAAVHAEGIVHRDITPYNVHVTDAREIYLLDFGISLISLPHQADARVTVPGAPLGTPGFMSPEQALGRPSDRRADIWAVGATLFFALTGEAPVEGDTAMAMVAAAGSGMIRSLEKHCPNAPPSLVAVIQRALSFAPEHRFSDVATFRQALGAPEQWELSMRTTNAAVYQWIAQDRICTVCRRPIATSLSAFEIAKRLLLGPAHCKLPHVPALTHTVPGVCWSCNTHFVTVDADDAVLGLPAFRDVCHCPTCGRRVRLPSDRDFFRDRQSAAEHDEELVAPCQRLHIYATGALHCLRCGHSLTAKVKQAGRDTQVVDGWSIAFANSEFLVEFEAFPADGVRPVLGEVPSGAIIKETSKGYSIRLSDIKDVAWWPCRKFFKVCVVPAPRINVGGTVLADPPEKEVHVSAEGDTGMWVQFQHPVFPGVEIAWEKHIYVNHPSLPPIFPRGESAAGQLYFVLPASSAPTGGFVLLPWEVKLPRLALERRDAPRPPVVGQLPIVTWRRSSDDEGSAVPLKFGNANSIYVAAEARSSGRPQWPADLPELVFRVSETDKPDELRVVSKAQDHVQCRPLGEGRVSATLRCEALRGAHSSELSLTVSTSKHHSLVATLVLLSAPISVEAVSGAIAGTSAGAWMAKQRGAPLRLRFRAPHQIANIRPVGASGSVRVVDTDTLDVTPARREKIRIDVYLVGFLNPVTVEVSVWPQIGSDELAKALYFDQPPEQSRTTSNPEEGIAACPHVAVGQELRLSTVLHNGSDVDIAIAAGTLTDLTGKLATIKFETSSLVQAGEKRSIDLVMLPVRASGAAAITFDVPIARPDVGASTHLQVRVQGVLPNEPAACFFYDFGTSNTALFAPLSDAENYLRETEHTFIRSRLFALWAAGRNRSPAPSRLAAPIADAVVSSESFIRQHCGYAMLEDIKTSFRLGVVSPTPIVQLREKREDHVSVPWYQPESATTLYDAAQRCFAAHVVSRLRSVPSKVLTALPITLRGRHRRVAIDSIRRAFSDACRETGSREAVVVDAPLDESTASAMEILYDLSRPERGQSGVVVVIDIGGGTTDITWFAVSPGRVRCIGFDGFGLGGEHLTMVVARILQRRAEEALQGDFPGCSMPLGTSDAVERSNRSVLIGAAEAAKILLMDNRPAVVRLPSTIRLIGPIAPSVVPPVEITVEPAELLRCDEFNRFVGDLESRALNAANLDYSSVWTSPTVTHVLMRGQASAGTVLRTKMNAVFGVEPDNLAPVNRKTAVVKGLAVMNRLLGSGSLQVGALERAVLLPVGRPDWDGTPLPRFFPLGVPATLWREAEVLQGMQRLQPAAADYGTLPAPAVKLRPDAPPRSLLEGQIKLPRVKMDPPAELKGRARALQQWRHRFRYEIWVSEDDELYGALYERSDDPAPVAQSSHPALLLIKELLRHNGQPYPAIDDFEEGGRHCLSLTGPDGVEWRTEVPASGIATLALQLRAGDRVFLVRTTTSLDPISWDDLLADAVRSALEHDQKELPFIAGVRLPSEASPLLCIAFAGDVTLGQDVVPPIFVEFAIADGGTTERWWKPVETVEEDSGRDDAPGVVRHFASYGLWMREGGLR